MTKEQVSKDFERYNPILDVVRCPYGRAGVRKILDSYARAAVNLYGIVSRKDLVDIFNKQNSEKTTVEEIYILLLPFVLKEGWYCFYKEYIVHYLFFDDFVYADYLLKEQADKPRYIPKKDEFLKYVIEDYEDNNHWENVSRFIFETFGYSRNTYGGFEDIRDYITYGSGINELGSILDKYNFAFRDENQLEEFLNLIMDAKNNTRIWENKGHTPSELYKLSIKDKKNIAKFPTVKRSKIGRNDPCPCGSGKKYKRCCGRTDNMKSARLSTGECKLFYETWYGLMGFVNERESVIRDKIKPEYPNQVNDMKIHKVREVLWEKPKLIGEYIRERELSQEEIDILKLWETNYKKGMFFILEYQAEYAVAIGPNEDGEDRLYGIKGISNPISNILKAGLPIQIETVLLPFKGKIIYDSFISSIPVKFGEGAKKAFREMYEKALKHGIVASLK